MSKIYNIESKYERSYSSKNNFSSVQYNNMYTINEM